jgi:hypothetical protein
MLARWVLYAWQLDSGVILAYFHDSGSACSSNELLKMLQTGFARNSEYSLSSQLGTSRPDHTLCGGLTLVISNTQNKHQALIPRIFRRMGGSGVGMLA